MANTVAVQWSVLWLVLWCSSLFMSAASGADVSPPEEVAYWDAALHGGSMPSTIRAMLSPLSAHQTTQLLLRITTTTGYLPTHAASFCKAAHIRCGQSNNITDAPAADPAGSFLYNGYPHKARSAAVAHHPKTATLVSSIKHRKAGPAALHPTKLPLAQATKDVVHASDADAEPNFFLYNAYGGSGGTVEAGGAQKGQNLGSDAELAKIRRASDADAEPSFFTYDQYGTGGVEEGQNPGSNTEFAKIRRASDPDAEPNFFMYNQYGVGGVEEGQNLGSDAKLAKIRLASDTDAEPNFFMYNNYDGSGGAVEATKNPDADAEPNFFMYNNYDGSGGAVEATKNPDADAEPNFFMYNSYGGSGGAVEATKNPDADADPNFFMYNSYGGSGGAVEATGNPASTSVDAAKVHASAVPLKDGVDSRSFKYNLHGSSGVKATKSPAADDHMQTEAVRSLLSSNIRKIPGIFFREKQVLVSGVRIYVHLATDKFGNEDQRTFLPRKLAQVFPLSSQAAQNLSSMLGASRAALQGTLDACQRNVKNDLNAEVSACLTSLEDISDFVSSVMGSTTKPIHTYDSLLNASNAKFSGKTYYVESVKRLKQDPDEPAVTCHDMAFPFRVFYCHYVKKTMIFEVTLQGDDDTSHNRIAVCHYDTTYWNPKHISFAELHTKPGQAEACHWLGKSWMGQGGWIFAHGA